MSHRYRGPRRGRRPGRRTPGGRIADPGSRAPVPGDDVGRGTSGEDIDVEGVVGEGPPAVLELYAPVLAGRPDGSAGPGHRGQGTVHLRYTFRPGRNATRMDPRRIERSLARSGRVAGDRESGGKGESGGDGKGGGDGGGGGGDGGALLTASVDIGALQPGGQPSHVERAQELMYEAFEASGARRVELAREALGVSPDCADAHVLLAEEAASGLGEALTHYERGMAAGQRALGVGSIEELEGEMWRTLETRPYMRARLGAAETLWRLGRRSEAIAHEVALMALNPGDNQGVRFRLPSHLLEEGRDAEVIPCMVGFRSEASASWLYSLALWTFRAEGPTWRAEARLRRAFAANLVVPNRIVLGARAPARLPAAIAPGSGDEAVDYTFDAMGAWRSTGGAVEWMAEVLRRALR